MSSKNDHIYFNATKSNLNNRPNQITELVELNILSESFQPIIDKGDDWEICVDKFKIPSTTIPKVRVYENELLLGANYDNTNANNYSTDISNASNVLFNDVFDRCGGRDGATYDSKRNSYYYDFYSQQEFANALDCTLAQSMFPRMLLLPDNKAALQSNSFPDTANHYQLTKSEMTLINQDTSSNPASFGIVEYQKTILGHNTNYIELADYWNKSSVMGSGFHGTDPHCSVFGATSSDPVIEYTQTSRPRKLLDLTFTIKSLNASVSSVPLSRLQLLLNVTTPNLAVTTSNLASTIEATGTIVPTQFLPANTWNVELSYVLVGSFIFDSFTYPSGSQVPNGIKFAKNTTKSLWGTPNNWINAQTFVGAYSPTTPADNQLMSDLSSVVLDASGFYVLTSNSGFSVDFGFGTPYFVWQNWVTTGTNPIYNGISIRANASATKLDKSPVGAQFVVGSATPTIEQHNQAFSYTGTLPDPTAIQIITYLLGSAKGAVPPNPVTALVRSTPKSGDDYFTVTTTDDWTKDTTGVIFDVSNTQSYGTVYSVIDGFTTGTKVINMRNQFANPVPTLNDTMQLKKPVVTNSINTTHQYVIAKNMFSNLQTSDFETMFPNGVTFSMMSSRSCKQDILKPETNPTFGFVDAIKMRDELLMTFADYNTYSIELAYLDSKPNNARIRPILDLTYLCSNTLGFANSAGVGFDDYGDPSNHSPSVATIPRIKYDESSQRLVLMMEDTYVNNGITIYTNGLLNNYTAFQSVMIEANSSFPMYVYYNQSNQLTRVIQNIYELCSIADYASQSGIGYTANYIQNGRVSAHGYPTAPTTLGFNLATNQYNQRSILSSSYPAGFPNMSLGTYMYQFYEYENSAFKRSALYGLVMLCNTIATTGEYTSGGQATTKILTDFDVDESTTDNRDYLLYQPAGDSFRWYDINSAQPINDINLQVRWVDKYNIDRTMFVGEGMTAKIKLHFRRR